MKFISTLILLLLVATNSSAQSKINPAGRLMIREFKLEKERFEKISPDSRAGSSGFQEPVVSAVVILKKGADASKVFDGMDLEIQSEMNGVVIVKCPVTLCEKIAELPEVVSVGFGDRLQPMLDFARPSGNVSNVQEGFSNDGQAMSFDGTGVVCGMMDVGLEANHINFKNSDGSSRIKRLWHMNSNNGSSKEYTDQTISQFTTDNSSEGHATHVAGIIGGSYKGNGKFMQMTGASSTSGSMKTNAPIPYYGVATGADLAFSVGQLYTSNIIQGVTNIIDYAESQGKPVVVNLSLGHTTGPHDGTDYYTQALSRLGERGIICMSAGNDGDTQISITKKLGATGNSAYLRTMPVYMNNSGTLVDGTINGIADLWTDSSEPVTVGLYLYTGNAGAAKEIMKVTAANQTVSSDNYTDFTSNFNGTATLTSSVDPNNNRYNVYMQFSGVTMKTGNSAKYIMLQVSGASGTKLYLYGNNVFFKGGTGTSTPVALTAGNANESINDGCCGDNVISVGAYTTRITWGRLEGKVSGYIDGTGYTVGSIAPFSSYGTTYQGKKLPLICAPGANIISSYSSYYAGSNAATTMCGSATSSSKTYYWGAMQGTSMSCPYVTGTIGLWLQADPSLDFEKVMEVIDNTSTPQTTTPARWGAGKLDALKGMEYVLANRAAIGQVWADPEQRLIVTASEAGYDVFVADGGAVTATLYDLQGRPVARTAGTDGKATVDAASLGHGVYILEVRGADYRLTRKVTR